MYQKPNERSRAFENCADYSNKVGADYRRLYQLKEDSASKEEIKKVKNEIKADKARLKNSIKRLNSG